MCDNKGTPRRQVVEPLAQLLAVLSRQRQKRRQNLAPAGAISDLCQHFFLCLRRRVVIEDLAQRG
jgi:hypothetical protein